MGAERFCRTNTTFTYKLTEKRQHHGTIIETSEEEEGKNEK